jgi:hypothetical protein
LTAIANNPRFREAVIWVGLFMLSTAPTLGAGGAAAAYPKLKPETQSAFDRYVHLTQDRNEAELKRGEPFLRIGELAEKDRRAAEESIRSGATKIEKRQTLDAGKEIKCPDGLIHHWEATSFIPGATVTDVLRILEDYDHHAAYYKPDVERSKTIEHDGEHFQAFLRFKRRKVITVVLNTTHDVNYFRDSPTRAHSRSSAIKIAQVENAEKSGEREDPVGDDDGYLWRMETWWRVEQKDGGVYIQNEVVSLTRDIPAVLGWLVGPYVSSIPKESLAFTMDATRKAVLAKRSTEESRTH